MLKLIESAAIGIFGFMCISLVYIVPMGLGSKALTLSTEKVIILGFISSAGSVFFGVVGILLIVTAFTEQ